MTGNLASQFSVLSQGSLYLPRWYPLDLSAYPTVHTLSATFYVDGL